MGDDREHIRKAIQLDARSGWALQDYAMTGALSPLERAIEINAELGRVLAAERQRALASVGSALV